MKTPGRSLVAGAALFGLGTLLWTVSYTPLREWPGLSSLVTIDAAIATVLLLAAGILATLVVKGRRRPLAVVAIVLLVLCAMFGGRAISQGVSDGSDVMSRDSGIAFVSWNSGDVGAGSVADRLAPLIDEIGAEIVVLPELGWLTGEEVGRELDARGFSSEVYAPEAANTSILLSPRLSEAGTYRIDESTPPWAGVTVRPRHPSAETPVIVGVHVQQPALADTATWQSHLRWVERLCAEDAYVVVIGDFNSTLNSLGDGILGSCRDVARAHGAGAAATWPTMLPPFMGVAIDRFLVGKGYAPGEAAFRVRRDIGGSDHWPITGAFPTGNPAANPGSSDLSAPSSRS